MEPPAPGVDKYPLRKRPKPAVVRSTRQDRNTWEFGGCLLSLLPFLISQHVVRGKGEALPLSELAQAKAVGKTGLSFHHFNRRPDHH